MGYNVQQQAEVNWYLKNGRFPERRISRDSHGNSYVIGDFSWNAQAHPHREEYIEPHMPIVKIG